MIINQYSTPESHSNTFFNLVINRELYSLRQVFELEYGKDKKTGYGQWLDLTKMPNNPEKYRSMVTEFAWKAFCHGRLGLNPNEIHNNDT